MSRGAWLLLPWLAGCLTSLGIDDSELDCRDAKTNLSDDVIRGCVMMTSCLPSPPGDMSHCLEDQRPRPCARQARTCADIERCLGTGFASPDECAGQQGWRCEGDVAIRCDVSGNIRVDCTSHGAQCDPALEPLGVLPCVIDDAEPCQGGFARCEDGQAFLCVEGRRIGQNCTAAEALCETDANNLPYCRPLRDFDAEPTESLEECENLDDYSCVERCLDGTRARLCVRPKILQTVEVEIDCADFGFSSCAEELNPIGGTFAVCR